MPESRALGTARRRRGVQLAALGLALLAAVLVSEAWIWLNLWPGTVGPGTALLWSLPQLYSWLLLLPGAAWLIRRFPVDADVRVSRIVLHAALSIAFAILALALLDGSDRLLGWSAMLGAPTTLVSSMRYTVVHLHFGIAVYWVLLGTLQAARFHGVAKAREEQLAMAQLDALRAQLRPHFLFNTLNTIAVLLRRDPAAAGVVLERLSRLLRRTLDRGDERIALADELQLTGEYLAIEQERFQDRLGVRLDIEDEVRAARVPAFLLQPVVENAVHHAIAVRAAPGTIEICARRDGAQLELMVRDDGPGLRGRPGGGAGIGLDNTRRRLESMYGAAQRLELRQRPEGGLEVRIVIPFSVEPA